MRPQELRDEDRERLATACWLPAVGPFSSFGRAWSVQTDDPDLVALVDDVFGDLRDEKQRPKVQATFRVLTRDDEQNSLVTRNQLRIGGGSLRAATMATLVWGINRWVLDEASRDHLLLHAGGVVRDDSVAVLLPAPSESGKSTLTTGLLDRSLGYLSDEAVALQPDGTVQGYAKPVSIDRGAWEVLHAHRPKPDGQGAEYLANQWHVRASRISRVARSGRLGAVIFPHYDPTARPFVHRLGPSESLLRAAECTFAPGNGRAVELSQVQRLAVALAGVPAYELVSTDLTSACEAVLGILEGLNGRA